MLQRIPTTDSAPAPTRRQAALPFAQMMQQLQQFQKTFGDYVHANRDTMQAVEESAAQDVIDDLDKFDKLMKRRARPGS